jgi:hypothetical protein
MRAIVKMIRLPAAGLCLMLAACAGMTQNGPDVQSAWVQVAPNRTLSVRALTKSATCPAILVDGKSQAMSPRGTPTPDFPDLICEASLPANSQSISIGMRKLPVAKAQAQRIVIIGDSGCRITAKVTQACNDPNEWPLAVIAAQISSEKPDAILHVGDFLYREITCPEGNKACAGSPFGDAQAAWNADWLIPAAPMFATAPLYLTRGNHELCTRAGKGWMRLLSPGPYSDQCRVFEAPYLASIGTEDIAIIDSAEADDLKVVASKVETMTKAVKTLSPTLQKPTWFLTHKPIWAVLNGDGKTTPKDSAIPSNATWAEVLTASGVPEQLALVLSGHIHAFQADAYDNHRPGQILMGVSGADLHSNPPSFDAGRVVAGSVLSSGYGVVRYGYMVLDRTKDGWSGAVKTPTGEMIAKCQIKDRSPSCTAG